MKYKLIKSYPNSRETGTIVSSVPQPDTASKTNRYIDSLGRYYGWHEVEDYPEYWEEIKEPTFKVGDWLYCLDDGWNDTGHKKYSKLTRKGDVFRIKEFDKCTLGDWNVAVSDDGRVTYTHKYPDKFRLATTKEIENHLIAEAEKKGFVEGIKFKGVTHPKGKNGFQVTCSKVYFAPVHSYNLGCYLYSNNEYIYLDGQWAEIVKEEEIKIGGYNTSFDYDQGMFYVGCRRFTFASIKSLYQNMCYFGISMVRVSDIDIEARTVKLILDRAEKQIK